MFEKIRQKLDYKNILILGFGKEGKSTLSFLVDYITGCNITVADKNDVSDFVSDGIAVKCGEGYLADLDSYDVIIKSPGIALSEISESVKAKLTSQTDLFLLEFAERTIGITGTKGKSTTTTLIHHILMSSGIDSVLTGNIGIPPLDSARLMKPGSVAVFEMSCHQLEFQKISPHIAVILNLFEDHLDHYGTREKYISAKENIYLHQEPDDLLIINSDCTEQIKKAVSKVVKVEYSPFRALDNKEIPLVGLHNHYNIKVTKAVTDIYGVSDACFYEALKTYSPLPHRLQHIGTKNGVDYYDDSISTVCQTTIQAITSLENVQTVLIGGMDRGIDYSELVDFFVNNTVKNIILMYESGKRIANILDSKQVEYTLCDDLDAAVKIAASVTEEGAKCVLSPAAASYGYFKNFEERGDVFKDLVNKL